MKKVQGIMVSHFEPIKDGDIKNWFWPKKPKKPWWKLPLFVFFGLVGVCFSTAMGFLLRAPQISTLISFMLSFYLYDRYENGK